MKKDNTIKTIFRSLMIVCIGFGGLSLLVNCVKIEPAPDKDNTSPKVEQDLPSEETVYSITYVVDGTILEVIYYTAFEDIETPAIPEKEHYTAEWEEIKISNTEKLVNAVYTPIEYKVTFVSNGEVIGTHIYTIEDNTLIIPPIPAKEHYEVTWESVTLDGGDKVVNAIYTPKEYSVAFVSDGTIIAFETYTIENTEITIPTVPKKEGYIGTWEEFSLNGGDKAVNAVYEEGYTITYIVITNHEAKNKTNLLDSYWTEALYVEENGYEGATNTYPTTYKSNEGAYITPVIVNSMITEGSTVYEYKFDGYFSDEECTKPVGDTEVWTGTGGYAYTIPEGTTGDITVYVKMKYVGSGIVSPW